MSPKDISTAVVAMELLIETDDERDPMVRLADALALDRLRREAKGESESGP